MRGYYQYDYVCLYYSDGGYFKFDTRSQSIDEFIQTFYDFGEPDSIGYLKIKRKSIFHHSV